jgi:integrase
LNYAPPITRLSETGNTRIGFFEAGDFQALCSNLPGYLVDYCRFGYIVGWRRGAIVSLEWTDVGDDVVTLRAENSKTRKPETVPLVGELRDIIERRREARLVESNGETIFSQYVFHLDGRPVGDFRKAWRTACKKAGVEDRLFHDLRRTAAKNMLMAGVPQAVAMRITGHRTDSMFRRYAIVDESQKRDALTRTANYLGAQAEPRKVAVMAAAGR